MTEIDWDDVIRQYRAIEEEWDPVYRRYKRRNPQGRVLCYGMFGRECDKPQIDGFVRCAHHHQIHRAYQRQKHDWNIPRRTVFAIYERCGGRCEICGDTEVRLEMHHLRYVTSDCHSISGRETPNDLALLCRKCHGRQPRWGGGLRV